MPDPEIVPVEAIQAGTAHAVDRSRQYQHALAKTPDKLLEGVNATGKIARGTRRDVDRMQQEMNLKLRNSMVIAIFGAAVANAHTIWIWFLRMLP